MFSRIKSKTASNLKGCSTNSVRGYEKLLRGEKSLYTTNNSANPSLVLAYLKYILINNGLVRRFMRNFNMYFEEGVETLRINLFLANASQEETF